MGFFRHVCRTETEKNGSFYEHLTISFSFLLSFPKLKGPRDDGGDWHFSYFSVVMKAVRKRRWWHEQRPTSLIEASRTCSANLFQLCSQLLHLRTPGRWQSTRMETAAKRYLVQQQWSQSWSNPMKVETTFSKIRAEI